MPLRNAAARLYENPVVLTLWIIAYLGAGFAIVYLWHVRMAIKVVAIIVVGCICPDFDDVVAAWRRTRTRKPQ